MMRRSILCVLALGVAALAYSATAFTDAAGPVTFEPPDFALGNINGQQGWSKTGTFDSAVAAVSGFPNAAHFGFGTQALRISSAVTSGSFGDQTIEPGVANPAGELTGLNHFDATFSIGSTQAGVQPGLHLNVSPDDGTGGRMSYLRFDDMPNGVHVIFVDVTDPGPLGTVANFNDHDIATLDRTHSHTVRFSIDFNPGPKNDVVKIYLDGKLKATGGTWEDYYRYDPEQNGNGNVVPPTRTLIFLERGTAAPLTSGNGFLIDGISFASSPNSSSNCGAVLPGGTYQDIVVPGGATCTIGSDVTVTHDVQVQKGGTLVDKGATINHDIHGDHPAGIGIGFGGQVGHNIDINGVTGTVPGGITPDNYVCNTQVGNDVNVHDSAAGASQWFIGALPECTTPLTVGHDLNVTNNANHVTVSSNTIGHYLNVNGNTGGTVVSNNTATGKATCKNNNPAATGGGNSPGTCPV
jgi:hypothetical protein